MIPIRSAAAGGLCLCVCLTAATAQAQTQSLFGNRGPLSTTGSSSTRLGSSSLSGGGLGATGLGSGSGTGGLGGTSGFGTTSLNTQLGSLSNTIGQGGFVGRSDNAGRFVGNRQAGQQTSQASGISGLQGDFRQGGQGGRAFSQFGQLGGQGQAAGLSTTAQKAPVRPQIQIGFDFSQLEPARVQTSLQRRFAGSASKPTQLAGVAIDVDADGRVVLRGNVPSEHQRRLAGSLARLEPGVRSVQNELVVEPPGP